MANNAVVGILRAMLTADTAQYDTKMRGAAKTAQDVDRQFKIVGKSVVGVGQQFERMVKSFEGGKVIHTATNMAAAIKKLGGEGGVAAGLLKLTAAEQARVNRVIGEGVEKARLLGRTVPAEFDAILSGTKKASAGVSFFQGRMIALGAAVGTFAAQIGIQAVRSMSTFVTGAFAAGSAIDDLAKKSGETVAAVQRMQYAARITGVGFEAFTDTAFRLRSRLATGSTSVRAAMEELAAASGRTGLSMQSSAEDIFRALSLVQDAQTRTRLGVELMGRSYGTVASAINQNYDAMAQRAKIATDEEIARLDRIDVEWNTLTFNMETRAKKFAILVADALASARLLFQGGGALQDFMMRRQQLDVPVTAKPEWFMDIPNSTIESVRDYAAELRAAQAIVDGLSGSARQQIASAQQLGASQDELTDLLGRFGVKAKDADNVLKVFTATMTAAKKEASELTQWIANNALEMKRLDGVFREAASAGLPMNKVLEEFGKQLDETVTKAQIFGQKVPQAVMAAAAAFSRMEAAKLEVVKPFDMGDIRGISGISPPDNLHEWDAHFDALDARQQQSVERRREGSISAAQFEIELAERRGASEKTLYRLIESLEQKKLDAALGAEQVRYETSIRGVDRTSLAFQQMERAHQETVAHLNEQWREGVERRALLFETATARMFKNVAGNFQQAFTSGFGTLLFGRNQDPFGRDEAEKARKEYERLKASGVASAEALTRAFRDWRDAEETHNETFADRWRTWWGGLKTSAIDALNDILGHFVRNFIGGMVKGLASSQLGQRVAGLFGMGGPGGGGAGNQLMNVAGMAPGVAGMFGGGGAGIAGMAGMNGGLSAAQLYGASAPGAAAPGATPFLTNPAFWTNPYTIAGIGAIIAGTYAWKKGVFRGGEEALKVNPRRDKFQLQFGGSSVAEAGGRLAALLTKLTGQDGGGPLFAAMQRADSVKEFESAQAAIVATLAQFGKRVKSFQFGGFVPPGAVVPAILHGGTHGETITPGGPGRSVNFTANIYAWDGADVDKKIRTDVIPRLKRALTLNTDDYLGHTKRTIQP